LSRICRAVPFAERSIHVFTATVRWSAIAVVFVLLGSFASVDASKGTVRPAASARFRIIYPFAGFPGDGAYPTNGLTELNGRLFGTTTWGGAKRTCTLQQLGLGCGVVFSLTSTGHGFVETVLYAFKGGADGAFPQTTLVADATGSLYGTTSSGGMGCGTQGCGIVFKLTPAGSTYRKSTVYAFRGCPPSRCDRSSDGWQPQAGLIIDGRGALYGTTSNGGRLNNGTVFRLSPGSPYSETILHSFQGAPLDGANPVSAVTMNGKGALFGTTSNGGYAGYGTVFELVPIGSAYASSVLYAFRGSDTGDGANPLSGVALADGALFGTTITGGSGGGSACFDSSGVNGCGIVFKLTPSGGVWRERVLHHFDGFDGYGPSGVLTEPGGTLYGLAQGEGSSQGVFYKMQAQRIGWTFEALYEFGDDAIQPSGGLASHNGVFYGVAAFGGLPPCYCGSAFAITP
jgi:uncharacterized repeat protein (TIGR03803 family)